MELVLELCFEPVPGLEVLLEPFLELALGLELFGELVWVQPQTLVLGFFLELVLVLERVLGLCWNYFETF